MIIRKIIEVQRTCLIAKRGTLTIIDVNHILQKSNLVKTNYSSARSILYQSEAWKKILKVRNEDNYFHGNRKCKRKKSNKRETAKINPINHDLFSIHNWKKRSLSFVYTYPLLVSILPFHFSLSLSLSLYPLHCLCISLFTVNNMQTVLNNGPREIKGTFHQLGSFLSKTNQPDFLSAIHKAAGTLACLPIHAACVTGFYR